MCVGKCVIPQRVYQTSRLAPPRVSAAAAAAAIPPLQRKTRLYTISSRSTLYTYKGWGKTGIPDRSSRCKCVDPSGSGCNCVHWKERERGGKLEQRKRGRGEKRRLRSVSFGVSAMDVDKCSPPTPPVQAFSLSLLSGDRRPDERIC